MKIKLLACVAVFVFLLGCSSKPTITVLCEQDARGNYLLKWEIYPEIDSSFVEIFVSDNDSIFPSIPEIIANTSDYIAIIEPSTQGIEKRKYFQLRVDGILSSVVSNRFFELDSIQNFRDIGGYESKDHRYVRWGKLFRSGSFSRMTMRDSLELDNLGVKTVIDLRSKDVKPLYASRYSSVQNVCIPISYNGYASISEKVLEGRFLRGDAIIYMQDLYRDMVYNFTEQYAEFFDYLCDENNYPIVYHCFLGKDQSGLATYFLLRALDIPIDMVEEDYMASEIGIDRIKSVRNANGLSESRQEAFTMLTKTDIAFLKYGLSSIKEKNETIDDYMVKELRITPQKKQKLKSILLR